MVNKRKTEEVISERNKNRFKKKSEKRNNLREVYRTEQNYKELKNYIKKNFPWIIFQELSKKELENPPFYEVIPKEYQQVFFTDDKNGDEYLPKTLNPDGITSCFVFEDKILVYISNNIDYPHPHFKFAILLHELGHAMDHKLQVNFNRKTNKVNIIEAEYFAHRFVIGFCQETGYKHIIEGYKEAVKNHYPCPEWTRV